MKSSEGLQYLLTLPARMAAQFAELHKRPAPEWFAGSDPAGRPLGSAGGTAHLLHRAWRETGSGQSLPGWLGSSRKLIIHGGVENRRLPAYACVGLPLLPVPVCRWSRGQRLDQTLLELQVSEAQRALRRAPSRYVAMIASGAVLVRFGNELPPLPTVDVLGLGMWMTPERARDYGVFFSPRRQPNQVAFFLQKPSPARLRELAADHLYLVDTGLWLLSERAVMALLERCGWQADRQEFAVGVPERYDLYGQFGLALGGAPTAADPIVSRLSCAVVPLPTPELYDFSGTRRMIESVAALQNIELDEIKLGLMGAKRHPDQYLQNARFEYPLRLEENHTLWVENSTIPKTWRLACDHVLTGVPANDWRLRLEPGVCLDFVPVGESETCVRCYGLDDAFQGPVGAGGTLWLGRDASTWFVNRGIDLRAAGIESSSDIHSAPLFPVLPSNGIEPRFLQWLFDRAPRPNPPFARRWVESTRLSSQQLIERVNLERMHRQRASNREGCLRPMLENSRWSVFLKLDLEGSARLYAASGQSLPRIQAESGDGLEPMRSVREHMFHAAVLRHRGRRGWEDQEARAFARLREMIVQDAQLTPVLPRCNVQEDQIVWGRSPVRLDLAGGWTDTPPYCLEHGGKVVNLAVDLNGQPPIQVFAKLSPRPELVMRSIDLGAEERIRSYKELEGFAQPGSEFAVAKAAFALAGFLPRFHAQGGFSSLARQLADFGGGIEVSLLSAVPKGSGLGTSSILAATLLATLGELCGLNWDRNMWFTRTLALEQMLTTGGGWQDQAGGIFRGIKLIETTSGLAQKPTLRWLPEHLFDHDHANKSILLYYTGLTRLAKNILHEIVRGIFLNSPAHLTTVDEIGANAEAAYGALQKADYDAVAESIRASWRLNQQLDAGTNPPAVQSILDPIEDYLSAAKLLGAGGGGYLLLLAKDNGAGKRIRETLAAAPPNPRARFVEMSVSNTALQITRS
jgi:galactokinase/mevalonate kinase-like predicted kinase